MAGLAVVRYPPGSELVPVGYPQLCAVLAATPERLYQFVGRLQSIDLAMARVYMNPQAAATAIREGYLPGLYAPVFSPYAQNVSGTSPSQSKLLILLLLSNPLINASLAHQAFSTYSISQDGVLLLNNFKQEQTLLITTLYHNFRPKADYIW